MVLLRNCKAIIDNGPAEVVAACDLLTSRANEAEPGIILRIAVCLYQGGLEDPQPLADAVSLLSTSKLFTGMFF